MKKITIVLLAAVALMTACKKQEIDSYHGAENLYFDIAISGFTDSVLYTFAKFPEKVKDTVYIPVRVAGNLNSDKDRTYSVKVIDSGTTAIPNIHFEKLKDQYLFSAGKGIQYLPVILYNTDTLLLNRSFSLSLEILPGGDFNADITRLITTRLVFSAKLEKPFWWNMWLGAYYSQVKHQLFRLAATTEDLTTKGIDAPKNLYFVAKLDALLRAPATWVDNNPGAGYVLTARPDGDFDFYNTGNPNIKFLYKKHQATGKYFFMDENGVRVE